MAESKARFLSNLIGADNTANDFTLPNTAVSGTNDKVLTSQGDGTVTWETTVTAPTITSVTTPASDNSINVDDNVVMTVTGTNFADAGMTAKLVDASNETSVVTGHDTSDLSVNYTNSTTISVTTRAATANISQSNVKLVIIKSGISATSASIGVSPDPTFTSINNPHATLLDNQGSGENVGSAISASASDGASISYSISGATSAGNQYIIDSASGQITTPSAGIADVSSGTSYSESPVVTATAGGDSTRTHTLSVPLVINKYVPRLFSGKIYEATNTSPQEIDFPDTMQPDLLWFKSRDNANSHAIYDSVRGINSALSSNSNAAPNTSAPSNEDLKSFDSDGFSLGPHDQMGSVNEIYNSNGSKVAWGWQAGGEPSGTLAGSGATASLTNGVGNGTIHNSATGVAHATSITQTVNQNVGFSITKYTGTAADNTLEVPHNLGGTPNVVLIKPLASNDWYMWHSGLGSSGTAGNFIGFNGGQIKGYTPSGSSITNRDIWGSGHDSSVMRFKSSGSNGYLVNYAGDFIVYAWKEVTDLSKFDSYQGNGQADANGKVLDIGFLPRFIMIKCITHGANWIIWDSFRSGATSSGDNMLPRLRANTNEIETSSMNEIQLYDNGSGTKGVQLRTTEGGLNNSQRTYIYLAFA